jgi:hypothetical protein
MGWLINLMQLVEYELKYSEKTYPNTNLYTINPIWPDLETHFNNTANELVILKRRKEYVRAKFSVYNLKYF